MILAKGKPRPVCSFCLTMFGCEEEDVFIRDLAKYTTILGENL